jgi:hypothetical protein
MDLMLGATEDPEGRAQHDHAAVPGHTGAFPLHAVRRGETVALCGAPVRVQLEDPWPPADQAACHACQAVLDDPARGPAPRDADIPPVPPFGKP